MNPLLEWHVYLGATVVGAAAVITAVVLFVRSRLRRARAHQKPTE